MKKSFWVLLAILVAAAFLRLWKIGSVPVSLFGDELDVGYQAYSILKTGRDYHGNFLPLHFQSLAEFRTPLYLYSTVPTVAVFGISPLGVRLPTAIFGVWGVYAMYLFVKELFGKKKMGLIAAAVLAFSPWHIQYSRAAFEVTLLLVFLLLGLYFFYRSLRTGKHLWISTAFLMLMPWVYSTAKLFTPPLLAALSFLFWKKLISGYSKKSLTASLAVILILGLPMAKSVLFSGEAEQRFSYISIFTDPTTESQVGVSRQNDARVRGETGEGLSPTLLDRGIHNKFTYWGRNILINYFKPFSADFLFVAGDPNPRHSIEGVGMFYAVEAVSLMAGLVLFFTSKKVERHVKLLIAFWIFVGVMPAAITRDGGNHATRLILILPPLIILIAYGVNALFKRKFVFLGYLAIFAVSFFFYQHTYWVHNPWYSERWWHAGYKEAIGYVKEHQGEYAKVIVTNAAEPPWIFFAGYMHYDPKRWQEVIPDANWTDLEGYGRVTSIDKYYFGSPEGGLYDWGNILDAKTLFMASEKEVRVNLIQEPQRTPGNLKLLESIPYPSGEPAFYLFTGVNNTDNQQL